MEEVELVSRMLREVEAWEAAWGSYEQHAASAVDMDRLEDALAEYVERLRGNYPFFHPRYAGQMLKPPHPVAVAAYAAAQRINPNNHALDGGPPTGQMEKEVVADLAAMLGLPRQTLGHLTGGGTVANLEALFVARELHPGKAVLFSQDAHYTHGRMSQVLGLETIIVPADSAGRMVLEALEEHLRSGRVGTVIATPGTTGLGAVDRIEDIVDLARRYGARVHADAAYGGFFTLLADSEAAPADFPSRHFQALGQCDSIAIDPHKHGLQPYGCGCILFRDPSVGRFYRHDSPYTYFTSDALHLGEISLECSRPGAAAGALWLTLRVLPLAGDHGLGPILAACLRAGRDWARRIEDSKHLDLFAPPELDIVTFFPAITRKLSEIDDASARLFKRAMDDPDEPVFLSLYRVSAEAFRARFPDIEPDVEHGRILRTVLMKPEHELFVGSLHERIDALAREILT
jgi:glutamate/tyrosine decarboxylase-like PLP-dependent enzyme